MSFLLILIGFMEKESKTANLGKFGVLRRDIGIPCNSVGPRRDVAEREAWTSFGYAEA